MPEGIGDSSDPRFVAWTVRLMADYLRLKVLAHWSSAGVRCDVGRGAGTEIHWDAVCIEQRRRRRPYENPRLQSTG
ncbi:hypothetical protein J437_LFUL007944 [Ladona fulva]|uniref:Uncharacterized protein n=1 Tax=Ladona fulva TaxID=123851 RepID=A0A8K0P525_LADFU|nr:hypothetical protein J437_LFUL007944 [Ladona fulva]